MSMCLNKWIEKLARRKKKGECLQIVKRLTAVSELSTVEYTVHKVIRLTPQSTFGQSLPSFLQRKMIYECKAIIKAGFDFTSFNSTKIELSEDHIITLRFPKAKILSVSIPPESIMDVYEHNGLLRKSLSAQERQDIQIKGQAQMEDQLKDLDIVSDAESNMRSLCESTFLSLGFNEVIVYYS